MKVLIVGSGGREHALAWKALQSPRLTQLYVAPGNAGTDNLRVGDSTAAQNVFIDADDSTRLKAFASKNQVDLVIIGPETPLANGLADDFRSIGIKTFGPSAAAAEIESSKVFAKEFMARHNIPSARFASFTDFPTALAYVRTLDYAVVVKASGLAAGKGVIVTETTGEAEAALRSMLLDGTFGAAGRSVVIEERLSGEEVSLLAFTDGVALKPMPPAQDHKRLLDGDAGPNTGGMGAYAPAPISPPELTEELTRTILQPAIDGLRAEGRPFVGVLYAGLMLTDDGPRVIEFNCRFGDPETQVIMPLLESDLLDVAAACADGTLATTDVQWKQGAAACVVLASEGYPNVYHSGRVITGFGDMPHSAAVFHAGTKRHAGTVVTDGGRVLGVVGWSTDHPQRSRDADPISRALAKAYSGVKKIRFAGMQYRTDIGHRRHAHEPISVD